MSILMAVALASATSDTRPVTAGMEVPNIIVRQHDAYVRCQDDHVDIARVANRPAFVAEVERAIAACKDQKASLMQEAEKALASTHEFADPLKRQHALCEAFNSYDEMRRAMALGTRTYKVTCY